MRYAAMLLLAVALVGCDSSTSTTAAASDPFWDGTVTAPRVRVTVLEGTKDAPADSVGRILVEARWPEGWGSVDTGLLVFGDSLRASSLDTWKRVTTSGRTSPWFSTRGRSSITAEVDIPKNRTWRSDSVWYEIAFTDTLKRKDAIFDYWEYEKAKSLSVTSIYAFIYCKSAN